LIFGCQFNNRSFSFFIGSQIDNLSDGIDNSAFFTDYFAVFGFRNFYGQNQGPGV